MDHQDAIREMSVERYLLGELTGAPRDAFEEHLFDCMECAHDLKAGVLFAEAQRLEVPAAEPVAVPVRKKSSLLPGWLLNPAWMAPALAACLAIVVYQSAFQLPRMEQQLAQANTPEVLNSLVLAGGASRGGGTAKISARKNGSFLISVDIPPAGDYSRYLCSLATPAGVVVWSGEVTAEQARDAIQVRVPTAVTRAGENTLIVQGERAVAGSNVSMEMILTQKFVLEVH